MVKKRTIVLYPHLGPKAGTGHIKRLIPFFYDERFDVYIIHRDPAFVKEVANVFNLDQNRVFSLNEICLINNNIDMIILDNKESDRYLYDKLKKIAPVVALDEGGDARDYIPYCIDTLPNLLESEPNYFNPGLLDLPIKIKDLKELSKVLVTFGGQDPYDLTAVVVDKLKDKYNLTTVIGPLFKIKDFGVEKIVNPKNLKDIISDYDLIITSFGITAYESIACGVPVALLNATPYHQDISDKAGFYSIDQKCHINYKKAKRTLGLINVGVSENLLDLIYNLNISDKGCPICGRKSNKSLQRFKDKSYFNCSHCLIDYMLSHKAQKTYTEDYFFDDYKNQYGKTYLEDFDNIENLGNKRLSFILKRLKKGNSILDIGCAYGPFLKASEKAGLIPYGIDVSEDAINYIKNTLGIKAVKSSFPISEPLTFPTPFNCIAMWYVIEHFTNLDEVLTQVNRLLQKGGVFCFSTPNTHGITGRKQYKKFLENSPDDHFSLWEPRKTKKILHEYGFKIYKINVTGHHPERFGTFVKGKILKKIVLWISTQFKLGDTFEIYCTKEISL